MSPSSPLRPLGLIGALLIAAGEAAADSRVSLTATAEPTYTERKYGGEKPKAETYVFMQGSFFAGYTVDRTLEHSRLVKENAALRRMNEANGPRPLIGGGEAMAEIKRLGITPILDLLHFGIPDWMGDFQNPDFPLLFADYAGAVGPGRAATNGPRPATWSTRLSMAVTARSPTAGRGCRCRRRGRRRPTRRVR